MQMLLDGPSSGGTSSENIGYPLPGSNGVDCSMYIQHNQAGSEPCDTQTLGCTGTVWASGGMQWGCIDGWNNYGGVSHRLDKTFGGSSQGPQSPRGCIHAYVSTAPPSAPALPTTYPSCKAVLEENVYAPSGVYNIQIDGEATPIWCDMDGGNGALRGGWALVYRMCQAGDSGIGSNMDIDHTLPVRPNGAVASVPYRTVRSMEPSLVRFASDFQPGPGYLFEWSTLTLSNYKGRNEMELLLGGPSPGGSGARNIGKPLPGSNGADCDMYIQHNQGGSEPCDTQTLGCTDSVWSTGGMQWGCIDGWNNYGGVSHRLDKSFSGGGTTAQSGHGCIHAYVRV